MLLSMKEFRRANHPSLKAVRSLSLTLNEGLEVKIDKIMNEQVMALRANNLGNQQKSENFAKCIIWSDLKAQKDAILSIMLDTLLLH